MKVVDKICSNTTADWHVLSDWFRRYGSTGNLWHQHWISQ